MRFFCVVLALISPFSMLAQTNAALKKQVDRAAAAVEGNVVEWRHHLHQNPELSNREFKTGAFVEAHLRKLGLEVRSKVAHTGVVGILRGGKPGPVIALRADMDALPVVERVNLPYASKVRSTFNGQDVGVMHACGHDTHTAMLMGAAEVLTGMRSQIEGTIVFLFQPAEEGAPHGEEGGAALMIKEGVLDNPKVERVFGLHIGSSLEVGKIAYKPGGAMAAVDELIIKVKGKGAHGSKPWQGVDPIAVSAQIINGLQYIVSRQMKLTEEACVVTVGSIKSGVRSNIIPEDAELWGTIRTLDTAMQREIHSRIRRTATNIAESMGATAEVEIRTGYPITYNEPKLMEKMLPTLQEVAGSGNVVLISSAACPRASTPIPWLRTTRPNFMWTIAPCRWASGVCVTSLWTG
jgi:amidohydrolase